MKHKHSFTIAPWPIYGTGGCAASPSKKILGMLSDEVACQTGIGFLLIYESTIILKYLARRPTRRTELAFTKGSVNISCQPSFTRIL